MTFTQEGFHASEIRLEYLLGWIFLEYPIPFLLLAGIGAIAGLRLLRENGLEFAYPWLPFFAQGAVLPLIIVVSQSWLYDRLRHIFFIVPPLCLLAGVGLYICFSILRSGSGVHQKAAGALGASCLLAILAASLLWMPYQYAYLNAAGRLFPHSFDTDYWGITVVEGVERMKQAGVKELKAGPAPIFKSYSGEKEISVLPLETPIRPAPGFYYVHSRESWRVFGLPDRCRTMVRIERQGVILGEGGEC